jgi:hypothetical protein
MYNKGETPYYGDTMKKTDIRWNNPYYKKFYAHQRRARNRGIDFLFTFEEWLEAWGDKINLMGRGSTKYCMARNGPDIGPYAPWNVRIITNAENISEGNKGKTISLAQYDRFMQYRGMNKKRLLTPAGEFESIRAAAKYYGKDSSTIAERISRYPDLYKRI